MPGPIFMLQKRAGAGTPGDTPILPHPPPLKSPTGNSEEPDFLIELAFAV